MQRHTIVACISLWSFSAAAQEAPGNLNSDSNSEANAVSELVTLQETEANSDARPAPIQTRPEPRPAPKPTENSLPADYTIRLKDLQAKVNKLKEAIHQSKARLIQLQEVVLHGTISGAKATILHRNEMGSSFRLERVQYSLDGSPIYSRVDQDGDLDKEEEIKIFDGSIVPGNHQLSVYMVYRGHGFGIFSYLNGYRFKIKSSTTFNAEEGKLTAVKIVAYEQGDITTDLAERPQVRYDIERKRALRAEQDKNRRKESTSTQAALEEEQ